MPGEAETCWTQEVQQTLQILCELFVLQVEGQRCKHELTANLQINDSLRSESVRVSPCTQTLVPVFHSSHVQSEQNITGTNALLKI